MRLVPLCLVAAVLLVGCGNDQTDPPDTGRILAPSSFRDVAYPVAGIRLRAPANWRLFEGEGQQVGTIAIGDAQIAVWSYERSEPLPRTRSQLNAARKALVDQVERDDPTFELTSTRLVIKPGTRAVELIGRGTNEGQRRAVRSLHSYRGGREVVVDAFAPPEEFARVDEETFGPVSRSLKVSAKSPSASGG
ncbi:MAG: hypothetical protein ACR2LK_15080 [Solirubrobacteraceae bacterium]